MSLTCLPSKELSFEQTDNKKVCCLQL